MGKGIRLLQRLYYLLPYILPNQAKKKRRQKQAVYSNIFKRPILHPHLRLRPHPRHQHRETPSSPLYINLLQPGIRPILHPHLRLRPHPCHQHRETPSSPLYIHLLESRKACLNLQRGPTSPSCLTRELVHHKLQNLAAVYRQAYNSFKPYQKAPSRSICKGCDLLHRGGITLV